jgi:hypothetical protein
MMADGIPGTRKVILEDCAHLPKEAAIRIIGLVRRRIMSVQTNFKWWLFKIGGGAAILGSLCAGVGNLLHPITPRDNPEGVAQVIAQSQHWTLIHLIITLGIILMLAGLIAIRHAIEGGLPEALARLGVYAGIVGVTVGMITVILDGVAAKTLADQWAITPASEEAVALHLVSTNETINFAIAGLFNMSFAGVPFILIGLAVALSKAFPRWLGWTSAVAGMGSIGAGLVQAFSGEPTIASLILTIIGPTVISLWLLVMGILLLRNTVKR